MGQPKVGRLAGRDWELAATELGTWVVAGWEPKVCRRPGGAS